MSKDPFQDREAEKYENPIPSREFIDHVTVHTEFHLFCGKVEVIFLTFCPQEAVAIAVANDFTAQEIKTFWQGITLTG